MRNVLYWIVAILIAIGILFVVFSNQNKDSGIIKIGFIGPLSGFGAPWGEEQRLAVKIASEEINKAGGIDGRQVVVYYEDGKCANTEAVSAAQKLISVDRVDFLLSVCGAEALAVAPIADQNKIVMISLWATNPQLSGISKYVFRNSYSDDDSGRLMAEAIAKAHKTSGILSALTGYPMGLRDAFGKYFTGAISSEDYRSSESPDLRTPITKILAHSPQAIFINTNNQGEAVSALNQLSILGYKGGLFMNFFGSIPDIEKMAYAEGMVFPFDPEVADSLIKERFYEEFVQLSGKKPSFDFAASISYDAIYILKKAIETVHGKDSDAIAGYLHSLRDFNGILGTYGFNEKGDAIGYKPSLKQIHDGRAVSFQL